jgi:gamma-glutamyltranspeptidase
VLARTLHCIAQHGADEFYGGETASAIDAFFASQGGALRACDLAGYRPEWVEPATGTYRGHHVTVMPPNSFGVLLLMQLNGLSALDSATLDRDPIIRLAAQIASMKAAFELGAAAIADPACVPYPRLLLGAETTAAMQKAVRENASAVAVPSMGGTACVLAADADGNAVNMVQSVFNPFGSGMRDPQSGIIFNNRMFGFTHRLGQPNSMAGGKRPAHTLCPVMVHRAGRLRYVLASPGGVSQTLTNVQVINNLIDRGLDVAAAVHAPRWCNTRAGDVLLEPEFSEAAIGALAAVGHKAQRKDDPYFYGSAKAIELPASGGLAGAADHRREASARGW